MSENPEGLKELISKLGEKLIRYFELESEQKKEKTIELIQKRKEIMKLKIQNKKYKRIMIPQFQVDLQDELEWMLNENERIGQQVTYIRNILIDKMGKPFYNMEIP